MGNSALWILREVNNRSNLEAKKNSIRGLPTRSWLRLQTRALTDRTRLSLSRDADHVKIEGKFSFLKSFLVHGTSSVLWQKHQHGNQETAKRVLTMDSRRIISDERISVERPFTTEWNLHLRQVVLSDAGTYECHINTNPVQSSRIQLVVQGRWVRNYGGAERCPPFQWLR
ncbi:protein amalgam-like isoform X4 [Elysia marginata]|uniref:Protein amalgam-like isoform X4 n=1 Tax=Elysia marginata TaxID=1093978 RepID=A0AAV4J5J1_9GAST|nr:protein amalgam-like isoform X4 [Elysia marginata]